jgi:hypothetical protein
VLLEPCPRNGTNASIATKGVTTSP